MSAARTPSSPKTRRRSRVPDPLIVLRNIFFPGVSSGGSKGLTLFLAEALLLCHGAFGFAHQLAPDMTTKNLSVCSSSPARLADEVAAFFGGVAVDEDAPHHLLSTGYLAVLLILCAAVFRW